MTQKLQHGAIRTSVLINILLGVGIFSAIIFLLFSNTKEAETGPQAISPPALSLSKAPAAPLGEEQIDKLKSTLEIETLKLERLRIQTERVRASQRRAQAVAVGPEQSTEIEQADITDPSDDNLE